ncbi:MAG: sigma-70 family RNA polymerase sigma factor [Saprospiraceae bacterium]|nr:sigma-70 family RNA polymerase sigma factor [Saprospiraceae bacterium]MCF8251233.1 sigma-70 family RNA polymerase sigma factor [Saprospiraceae bacterium]MCF8281217.1 sigma-70 family RNA polymerase sigma factor [Bacteroidales bacterium]MCF8313143.1 sigma-70 family RNA polymerase sigma factor [Saprospiraceae bacterium]MCF8441595.1 sigma-70 family RNA polymerase sigma factor [Saprospiraceae bacterium]
MLQPIADPLSDEALLLGLKGEQNSAFQAIYHRYGAYVRHYVLDNSGTEDDAEDVFQEALIALVQNLRKPGFSVQTNIGSFFQAIVRNWWMYKLRGRRNNLPIENLPLRADDTGEVFVREAVFSLKEQLVANAFGQIAADCQQVIHAFYLLRKPLAEIAEEMGYSDQFIKQKKMRCMNALRNKVFGHPNYQMINEEQ